MRLFKNLSLFFFVSLVISESYILVFEQGPITPNKYVQLVKDKIVEFGGKIGHEYSTVLTGFSFYIPDDGLIDSIKFFSDSKYPFFIEKDSSVSINDK